MLICSEDGSGGRIYAPHPTRNQQHPYRPQPRNEVDGLPTTMMRWHTRYHEPMKRRRLDLGDLMVKTTGPTKAISDKPTEQFRTVRRPEITRLDESDPMPPPPANKSMGRVSGKDGRPTVSGLIQAREAEEASRDAEAVLRKELAEDRKRHEASVGKNHAKHYVSSLQRS